MKSIINFAIISALTVFVNTHLYSQTSTEGIFVGSSPCGNNLKPLFGIPADGTCEYAKWTITLYPNATFHISCLYGDSKPNTSDFIGGGKKVEFDGKWQMQKGTKANENAVIYMLTLDKPNYQLSFVKLDENIIHLLDANKNLMIGNSGYNFTFSRLIK